MARSSRFGERQPLGFEVGVFGRRAEAGEVLGGRGDAPCFEAVGEGDRGARDGRRRLSPKERSVSAMTPPGRPTSRTGARSTLTPSDFRLAAVARALAARVGRPFGAHRRRRGFRRAVDPLHLAALLVGHHQQRQVARRRLGRGIDCTRVDQFAARGAAGEVGFEEDDAGDLPGVDRVAQFRRQPGPVDADHDPLPGQLARASAVRRASAASRRGAFSGRGRAAGRTRRSPRSVAPRTASSGAARAAADDRARRRSPPRPAEPKSPAQAAAGALSPSPCADGNQAARILPAS